MLGERYFTLFQSIITRLREGGADNPRLKEIAAMPEAEENSGKLILCRD